MYFFSFDFKYVFGGLIGLGCGDLGVLGKHWMSSFQKTKEIKISMVGSKVMTSGRMLTCFSRFSQYLNRFNSNFDP